MADLPLPNVPEPFRVGGYIIGLVVAVLAFYRRGWLDRGLPVDELKAENVALKQDIAALKTEIQRAWDEINRLREREEKAVLNADQRVRDAEQEAEGYRVGMVAAQQKCMDLTMDLAEAKRQMAACPYARCPVLRRWSDADDKSPA